MKRVKASQGMPVPSLRKGSKLQCRQHPKVSNKEQASVGFDLWSAGPLPSGSPDTSDELGNISPHLGPPKAPGNCVMRSPDSIMSQLMNFGHHGPHRFSTYTDRRLVEAGMSEDGGRSITEHTITRIRRIVVPVELCYPDNDMKKKGSKPTTFSGKRALGFVLETRCRIAEAYIS